MKVDWHGLMLNVAIALSFVIMIGAFVSMVLELAGCRYE